MLVVLLCVSNSSFSPENIRKSQPKEISTVAEVLNRLEIFVDLHKLNLNLIFSLLRRFTLKITSPINSEDHSFYKYIKRFAVRFLSDSKLSRSARVLKSNKVLLLVF